MPCPSATNGLHLCETAIHKQFRSRDVAQNPGAIAKATGGPPSDRHWLPAAQAGAWDHRDFCSCSFLIASAAPVLLGFNSSDFW
jgi:hypothetical protein